MADMIPGGTVSLAGARKVAEAALAEATRRGVRVAVLVTGVAADPLALLRMDGVAPLAAETAHRKCWSVCLTRHSTREFGGWMRRDLPGEPELFHGMLRIGDMMVVAGGVPLLAGDAFCGAVAVSGASSDDDHEIAEIAAAAFSG